MEYVRKIDFDKLNADGAARPMQWLLDRQSGAEQCAVLCIKTPPGAGSESGLHTHPFEQVFYLVSGSMDAEIGGKHYHADAGSILVFPRGMPHRNWNAGDVSSIHLSFMMPLAEPGVALTTPVDKQ